MAGAEMTLPETDPPARSFALLDEAERARLGRLLRPLPWIDGLIAAIMVEPVLDGDWGDDTDDSDETGVWLDHIWSKDNEAEIRRLAPPEVEEVVSAVLGHSDFVADALCEGQEAVYRPYLEGYGEPLEAAAQWAAGFCWGMSLHVDAWDGLFADEEAQPMLAAIFSLVRDEDIPNEVGAESLLDDVPAAARQAMRRDALAALPEIVPSLFYLSLGSDEDEDEYDLDTVEDIDEPEASWKPAETCVRAGPKVGRNDPCPCGSGAKYKKCCLGKE
jgi:yecA family protein